MKWPLVGAALLAVSSAAALWYASVHSDSADRVDQGSSLSSQVVASVESASESASPFALSELDDTEDSLTSTKPASLPERSTVRERQIQQLPSWDTPLSEEQLSLLIHELKNNPALLQQLVDEFRQETDPQRKQRLAQVLGAVGGEQVTLLASELIFSGDSDARTLGMNLLQEIQPGNAQARDIVSGMLATEVDPPVLIEALTALAKPGDVEPQSRAYLSDQVAWLTSHQDDGVRSISLDILSRWSDDGRYTEVLLAGLDDSSEYVRSSAAYSLVQHEDKSPVVIDRLFRLLRNPTELKSVKRAAILALRNMPLSSDQGNELDELEAQINTVAR